MHKETYRASPSDQLKEKSCTSTSLYGTVFRWHQSSRPSLAERPSSLTMIIHWTCDDVQEEEVHRPDIRNSETEYEGPYHPKYEFQVSVDDIYRWKKE